MTADRNEVLEEAAQACDEKATDLRRSARPLSGIGWHVVDLVADAYDDAAASIRKLRSNP